MKGEGVLHYDKVARTLNKPIYSFYAAKILQVTGLWHGVCLDAGCGGGYLGLAMARLTDMDLIFLDQSEEMLQCASDNLRDADLFQRGHIVKAPVQKIPFAPDSIDLVISRGSLPFWHDLASAFAELYRVTRPGGWIYIGGGLGPPALREKLLRKAEMCCPEWARSRKKIPKREPGVYEQALAAASIPEFSIYRGDEGTWIVIQKKDSITGNIG